ncbi:MAG TPA: hypothetical protein VGZ91_10130 [Candidatus Sulfotelmatobacter sp.]|jgi:DUF4097 and DUF4098 domain-containing protein YvlB|nr:hypothetical protein [Candidatus Sulfotelmatobacter sp.]
MLKKFSKLVAALLLLLPLSAAQEARVYRDGGNWARDITGTLAAAKNIRIKVDMGSVRVAGGSQSGISYMVRNRAYTSSEESARREFDSYKVSAYVRGDTAWIVAEWQGGRPHRFSGEFTVNVPRDTDAVKLETDGGSVSTTGIVGRVDAQSGGGSIHLDDIGGAINAETGGGGIDVGTTGGDLSLRTGGGSIKVVSSKGKISAESGGGSVVVISGLQGAVLETGGGSIEVERCAGHVKATTGGGSIDLGEIGGPAEIETGGGSIRLASAKGPVHAETGGGSIELNGVPSARAETGAGGITAKFVSSTGERTDSVLETSAGDITVYLAPSLALSIRASIEVANGHSIRSDFSEIRVTTEGGDYGPKTVTADGSLNGGGPVLKVRTTTGDIWFRRAK